MRAGESRPESTIMSEFIEYAPRYFDFLSKRYGFRQTVLSPSQVRYENNVLYFDITHHWRDGTGVDFGRLDQPGILPEQAPERLNLGTVLGAINTSLGTYKKWARPPEHELAALSAGLVRYADALVTADPELYRLLREVRYWHVGDHTHSWGKSSAMSPSEIARNRQLVPNILRLMPTSSP